MPVSFGSPISLKGIQGIPGSQIIFGTGTPDPSVGRVGDVFFATDTTSIYPPKTANGWASTGQSLMGKAGLAGANGFSFDAGANNPKSTDGNVGDFWMNYSSGEVFGPKGSDNSWPDTGFALRGPQGPAGANGLRGSQTYTGNGAPNLSNYPNAQPGDVYYDLQGGPAIYFLQSS